MGPSSPPSLCPQKEGHLEKISTSFFSTVLAGYQSCRTHQDTQGSAQGFSSPYQNILSGSTQTARVPSLHTLSEPPLLQRHDPFHDEMDPLGEALGSWSGATASGYPVSYSPHCLPVSSGLGLERWLRILQRVFAAFVPMDAAMRGFGWSVLPSAGSSVQTRRCGEETRKRLQLPSALPKMLQRKNAEHQQGL